MENSNNIQSTDYNAKNAIDFFNNLGQCPSAPVTSTQPSDSQINVKNMVSFFDNIALQKSTTNIPRPPNSNKRINTNNKDNKNKNKKSKGIRIFHWNKGSSHLENKIDEIKGLFDEYKPDIFGISEANFFKHHDINKVQIENYDLHLCTTLDNPTLNISRVAVYTHKSLNVKPRPDLMDNKISAIWLEVGHPGTKKILICNAYREWGYMRQQDNSSRSDAAQLARWETFISKWQTALYEEKETIVLGDMNIDCLKWSLEDLPSTNRTYKQKALIRLIFENIFPLGVSQHVRVPTYSSPGQTPSGIDHLYTNRPEKITDVIAHQNGGSDHKILEVTRLTKAIQRKPRYIRKRIFKDCTTEKLLAEAKQLPWFDLYMSQDANTSAEILTSNITSILDKLAPVKTIQIKSNYAPWLNDKLKAMMRKRDEAQRNASRSGNMEDWRLYKNLRNSTTSALKDAKKDWESKRIDNVANQPRDMWANLKRIMKWKSSGPPTQLVKDGIVVTSPSELANTMNEFFIEKVKNFEKNLPPPTGYPLAHLKEIMKNRTCHFSFHPVHPKEVEDIISKLRNSGSTGIDEINTTVIKQIMHEIIPALTHVINTSLSTLTFPECWKKAKIIPLLKKGDPLQPKNYRPVSLLPVLSKILERVVYTQVIEYLDRNGLFHPSHHGSRAGHSTTTALIEMYDQWLEGIENNEMTAVMMIDLSAAFDLVNHDLFLQKLATLGFDINAVTWFWSYLTGRSQQVYVDGKLSNSLLSLIGTAQGTILGALIYIIFTVDLPEVVHDIDEGCTKNNEHSPDESSPSLDNYHASDDQRVSNAQPNLYNQDEIQTQPDTLAEVDNISNITETLNPQANYTVKCTNCGNMCCYVDDGTYQFSSSCSEEITNQLSTKYQKLAEYIGNNRLVINHDKTQLVVMGTKKFESKRGEVYVDTGGTKIFPSESAKLLGLNVHQSLKWGNHLITNSSSLLKILSIRLNGLKYISYTSSFKTRLMVANACFMSILIQNICIWSGTEDYLLKSIQTMQNKVAKFVTRDVDIYTPTRTLLRQCGWLSVKQLGFYHSVLLIWNTLRNKKPVYIHSKLLMSNTRSGANGNLKIPPTRTALASKSFMIKARLFWNQTPAEIRLCHTLETLKKKLKSYIIQHISIT